MNKNTNSGDYNIIDWIIQLKKLEEAINRNRYTFVATECQLILTARIGKFINNINSQHEMYF